MNQADRWRRSLASRLLALGRKTRPEEVIKAPNSEVGAFIRGNPYAFCLAACLNRGMKVETVWAIPWEMKRLLGHLNPFRIDTMSLQAVGELVDRLPHRLRYYRDAPRTIKEITHLVVGRYAGKADRIWRGQRAKDVRGVFLSVHGVGEGIAAMIVVLIDKAGLREPFPPEDRAGMDVKPDVHVRRVLFRIGIAQSSTIEAALDAARRLNPACPGDLNEPLWDIGRTFCHAFGPRCSCCPITKYCKRTGLGTGAMGSVF